MRFIRLLFAMVEQATCVTRKKPTGRAFYESIGKPSVVLAPMVDQSEFVSISLLVTAQRAWLTVA